MNNQLNRILFKEIYENPMRNLNNVVRYSGVFCMKPENDGYHIIDMMAMCMKIADIIEFDYHSKHTGDTKSIDRKDLIYRCYIHDLDESLMGDISRTIKYFNDEIYDAINSVADELMESTFSSNLVKDIRASKDANNLCGLIVRVADTLQSSIKIYEECKLGNFHFEKVIKENITFVANLRDKIFKSKLSDSKSSFESSAVNTLLTIIDEFESELAEEINRLTK